MNKCRCFLSLFVFFALTIQPTVAQNKRVDSKYKSIIANYLKSNKRTLSKYASNIDDLYISKTLFSEKTGVANVYLNQTYKGVKIFNAISGIGIKNDNVFHFTDRFETNIPEKINTLKSTITPQQALSKLVNHFNLGRIEQIKVLQKTDNKVLFSAEHISKENIPIEKVYVKVADESLKLAWDLSVLTRDGKHWWSVRVDAVTGDILDINDWMVSCNFKDTAHRNRMPENTNTHFNLFSNSSSSSMADGSQYRVYALPVESPNYGSRTLVTEPANAMASPFGWHDDDGITGADYTTTQGNNVIVQEDINGDNGTGTQTDGGISLNFDFPIDLNRQPQVSLDAALTNLFYVNNAVHDIIYYYGFNAETGAFQNNHYELNAMFGTGDPVLADGLDGSGSNNANFGTPPDGFSPRMQMFLWTSANNNTLTINGGSLDGDYIGIPANFGGELTVIPLIADLALSIDDNTGDSTDVYDACDTIINSLDLTNKIAIINRGTCEFGDKLLAVENAGAIAAIVITDDRPIGTMNEGTNGVSVTIPGIMISRADGDAIIEALTNGESINASLTLPFRIDGSYDNGIIIHEYAHGISNRLTGGADNVNCLLTCTERDEEGRCNPETYTEQMGEGWSDWFALMLTIKPTDASTDGRGIGTFAIEQPANGRGIRPYRYSTDRGINPLTYNDTNDTSRISAPHGVGSVWCTMLWDLTWAYIDKYGFDTDLYNGTGGNNKVMQIVMDGMKLQPCQPGFIDGRDAILAADRALTGGEDQCMIWDVFAARGLGVNADQQSNVLRTDQVEGFDTPNPDDPSLVNCTATFSATDFNAKAYKIYPNPASTTLTIKAEKALGAVTIDLLDVNGRIVLTKSEILLNEIELNTSSLKSGLYILKIKGDDIHTNEKIIIK